MAALLGGLAGADEHVGADAVGDEGLRSVDHVAAVDPLGRGADARDVGSRAGLGDAEGADLLPSDRRPQEALLLVVGAELEDRRRGDAGVGAEAGAHATRAAGPGELLGPDGVVEVVATLAAQLHRVLEAEEAELGGAVIELSGELSCVLPLVEVGGDLRLHPAVDRLAQLLVLGREGRQDLPGGGCGGDAFHMKVNPIQFAGRW